MEPIVMKLKNHYWGRRSGAYFKTSTSGMVWGFRTRKYANGSKHSGPTGLQLRWRNVKVK